jgi:hypothetical protein
VEIHFEKLISQSGSLSQEKDFLTELKCYKNTNRNLINLSEKQFKNEWMDGLSVSFIPMIRLNFNRNELAGAKPIGTPQQSIRNGAGRQKIMSPILNPRQPHAAGYIPPPPFESP